MLNKLNSLRDREAGFTLIELLIVVIIIGILAAIALPIFLNQQRAAHEAAVVSDVRNTVAAVNVAKFNNGSLVEGTGTYDTNNGYTVSKGDTVVVAADGTAGDYTVTGTGDGTRDGFKAIFTSSTGHLVTSAK